MRRCTACLRRAFQCSSASRKFLNGSSDYATITIGKSFSALQRAENSSTRPRRCSGWRPRRVSVLFSEPKIPQPYGRRLYFQTCRVSVLFSEPKIPQHFVLPGALPPQHKFQCSSASRKFLNGAWDLTYHYAPPFQCSSASRKFLNSFPRFSLLTIAPVSVLFSEPKIPQPVEELALGLANVGFQCSSASRKFLNLEQIAVGALRQMFQCSSASRKFLNSKSLADRASVNNVSVLFSEPKIPQPAGTVRHTRSVSGFSALQRAENSSTQRA